MNAAIPQEKRQNSADMNGKAGQGLPPASSGNESVGILAAKLLKKVAMTAELKESTHRMALLSGHSG